MVPTVEWKDGAVRLLDQSRLPESVEFLDCRDYQTVADAIRNLKVRGAPAIGVTAAMGVALGAQTVTVSDYEAFAKAVLVICDHLAATRPTAVNLFWAVERMKRMLASLHRQPIASIRLGRSVADAPPSSDGHCAGPRQSCVPPRLGYTFRPVGPPHGGGGVPISLGSPVVSYDTSWPEDRTLVMQSSIVGSLLDCASCGLSGSSGFSG